MPTTEELQAQVATLEAAVKRLTEVTYHTVKVDSHNMALDRVWHRTMAIVRLDDPKERAVQFNALEIDGEVSRMTAQKRFWQHCATSDLVPDGIERAAETLKAMPPKDRVPAMLSMPENFQILLDVWALPVEKYVRVSAPGAGEVVTQMKTLTVVHNAPRKLSKATWLGMIGKDLELADRVRTGLLVVEDLSEKECRASQVDAVRERQRAKAR